MQLTHCEMMSGMCAVFWWHFGGCVAPRRVCASAVAAWHREHHGRCWHDTRSVVYWCSIQPKYSTVSSYMCLTLCSGLFRTPIAGYKPGQRELKVHRGHTRCRQACAHSLSNTTLLLFQLPSKKALAKGNPAYKTAVAHIHKVKKDINKGRVCMAQPLNLETNAHAHTQMP